MPSDILLPRFLSNAEDMKRWAVIACDQFTSDVSYWDRVEAFTKGRASTYDYILPEAFLGSAREEKKAADVVSHMRDFDVSDFAKSAESIHGYVYLERTLASGDVRRGIVGMIDLEAYDFAPESSSPIRATEETVTSRIPARCRMRRDASIELPHVLLFADDRNGIFECAKNIEKRPLYNFCLMENGGSIRGYAVEGDAVQALTETIAENESRCAIPYAVGDGNHSLAAAKAHYDEIRRALGASAAGHPARYALCELVSVYDEAIKFEPIYRLLTGIDREQLKSELNRAVSVGGEQSFTLVMGDSEETMAFAASRHPMTVGTLQAFIDEYISTHPGAMCDYIHGRSELIRLSADESSAGFLTDCFERSELFKLIVDGPLPRKTFSMGDAFSKRYYIESRRIIP